MTVVVTGEEDAGSALWVMVWHVTPPARAAEVVVACVVVAPLGAFRAMEKSCARGTYVHAARFVTTTRRDGRSTPTWSAAVQAQLGALATCVNGC